MEKPIEVDMGSAIERCSGDCELLSQVVTETIDKSRDEAMPKIKEAIASDDVTTVHFHAHSIKGASATVGFLSLSAAAKELDDLAKLGKLDGAVPLCEAVEAELARASEYFTKHTNAESQALERCGGDTELFYQIAKEMVTDVLPDQVESLAAGVAAGDTGVIQSAGDQLLDAAETIGAFHLMDLVKRLLAQTTEHDMQECMERVNVEVGKITIYWQNVEGE